MHDAELYWYHFVCYYTQAIDAGGDDLFISDNNAVIRKLHIPTMMVTTVANNGGVGGQTGWLDSWTAAHIVPLTW